MACLLRKFAKIVIIIVIMKISIKCKCMAACISYGHEYKAYYREKKYFLEEICFVAVIVRSVYNYDVNILTWYKNIGGLLFSRVLHCTSLIPWLCRWFLLSLLVVVVVFPNDLFYSLISHIFLYCNDSTIAAVKQWFSSAGAGFYEHNGQTLVHC